MTENKSEQPKKLLPRDINQPVYPARVLRPAEGIIVIARRDGRPLVRRLRADKVS